MNLAEFNEFNQNKNRQIEQLAQSIEDMDFFRYHPEVSHDLAIKIRALKTNTNVIPFPNKKYSNIDNRDWSPDDDPDPSSPSVAMRKVA